jgi:hypothetical protein
MLLIAFGVICEDADAHTVDVGVEFLEEFLQGGDGGTAEHRALEGGLDDAHVGFAAGEHGGFDEVAFGFAVSGDGAADVADCALDDRLFD